MTHAYTMTSRMEEEKILLFEVCENCSMDLGTPSDHLHMAQFLQACELKIESYDLIFLSKELHINCTLLLLKDKHQ